MFLRKSFHATLYHKTKAATQFYHEGHGEALLLDTCQGIIPESLLLSGNHFHVKIFYLLSSPWSFSEKSQARFYTWVACKTIDGDNRTQVFPSKMIDQMLNDSFKGHSV